MPSIPRKSPDGGATKNLAEHDRKVLADRGIALATAERNGLKTVGNNLVIPYRTVDGSVNGYCLRRPHNPPVKDGKELKYLAPKDEPSRPFFPDECLPNLTDATVPLLMTEGPLKALALAQVQEAYTVIGLQGVENWHGKGDEELLPELAALPWTNRDVYIVFDTDPKPVTRENVGRAKAKLARALRKAGCRQVFDIVLPLGPPTEEHPQGGKCGVDDFLATRGAEALAELMKAPPIVPDPSPKSAQGGDLLLRLADDAEFWHTPDGAGYASVPVREHKENYALRSKGFKEWLGRQYYLATKWAPSAQAMTEALAVLEARAKFDGEEHQAYVRVAPHDGNIVLDLGRPDWSVVLVSPDGWHVWWVRPG